MVTGGKCQGADHFSDMAHSSEHTPKDQRALLPTAVHPEQILQSAPIV